MSELPTEAEQMYCFAIHQAAQEIARLYAPLLKELGVTYPQYMLLTILWSENGIGARDLADRMRMEPSTLTSLLKKLEALDLIARKRGTDDERKVFIWLTDKGAALQTKAPEITRCVIAASEQPVAVLEAMVLKLGTLTETLAARNAKHPLK